MGRWADTEAIDLCYENVVHEWIGGGDEGGTVGKAVGNIGVIRAAHTIVGGIPLHSMLLHKSNS